MVSIISSAGTVIISLESTTKSAFFPTSSEPTLSSLKDACAGSMVRPRRASRRVRACSGNLGGG